MPLTARQRKRAKALAHPLSPTVQVGQNGVTDALLEKVRSELELHELIKIKVAGESSEEAHGAAELLAEQTHSDLVQIIGKTVVLYKRRREKPIIELGKK